MIQLTKFVRKNFIFLAVFIIALSLGVSNSSYGKKTVNFMTPPKLLQPTHDQKVASLETIHVLFQNHYKKLHLNQELADKFFNRYLERLDPQKLYFLKSDIKKFQLIKKNMIQHIKNTDLKPAYIIYYKYQKYAYKRYSHYLTQLKSGIDHIDFSLQDTVATDRKKEPWLTNKKAQKELWNKKLKESILSMQLNKKTNQEIIKILTKRYQNILREIHQSKSEDITEVYLNAIASVFDPHTNYFSPETAKTFEINMSLSLEGIGAVLSSDNEYITINRIVRGGPADLAGQLQVGDRIVAVAQGDNKFEDIVGARVDQAVKLIRGKKKTVVQLEVIPSSSKNNTTKLYKIVRDKVKLEQQEAKSDIIQIKDGNKIKRFGVITLPSFYLDFQAAQAGDSNYKSTTRDVKKLINKLKKENIDGLIMDLRTNPGGSLQEANQLSGLFIHNGSTVLIQNSNGHISKQIDPDIKQTYKGPLAVMINRFSASAAEIFAAAMQDYGRGLIIGERSYGKGTVQTIQPLSNGQLKLTTAKFYRVSGISTQNQGVLPDITYPDLLSLQKIGENTLPNALPMDSIKPVNHYVYNNFKKIIPILNKQYLSRTLNNPDFIYIKNYISYFKKYNQVKNISLNKKQRLEEIKQMQEQRLNIENELRIAKGKKSLKNLDELEKINNKKLKKDNKEEKDPFLNETAQILNNYIKLKNSDHQISQINVTN